MTYSMVSIMQATFGSITWLLPTEIVAGWKHLELCSELQHHTYDLEK
jgi:hypothetical protein